MFEHDAEDKVEQVNSGTAEKPAGATPAHLVGAQPEPNMPHLERPQSPDAYKIELTGPEFPF